MTAVLEKPAKITAQGQTTIPAEVRQVLGVGPGDQVTFTVDEGGRVSLRRADAPDPAIGAFLDFLAADMRQRPAALQALTPELEARLRALTAETEISDDDVIEGDVGL
jgi:antitoxin PrlF